MKRKEIILVILLCLITFFVVRYNNNDKQKLVLDMTYEQLESDNEESGVLELEPDALIESLQNKYKNNDIKAELRIENTNFKTPIPQSSNNTYYYRRLPNKSYSIIGSTYLDYRTKIDESRVLIIYGHNSSKYDMPFKVLENYYSKEYYDNHKYLELVTASGIKKYEVFSVFVETSDFSYYTDIEFENNKDFINHINKLKNKSFYDTNVSLNENDNILILQACSTHKKYQKYKNKFVLIISREVRNDEGI